MEDRAIITEGFHIADTGTPGECVLQGNLTIEHAEGMWKTLLDIVNRHDAAVVHFDSRAQVDLSLLQLLCSACRTAMKQGKSFTVGKDMPDTCRSFLDEAGYSRNKGCSLDTKHQCLWITGGRP